MIPFNLGCWLKGGEGRSVRIGWKWEEVKWREGKGEEIVEASKGESEVVRKTSGRS